MITSSVPVLAQVQHLLGSSNPRYVLQAEDYEGFLVQRRYRRLEGKAEETVWYEPYLHPFVCLERVAAAGLEWSAVQQWLAQHPGEAFTHPLYRALCLRWGVNPHDYLVVPYRQPLPPHVRTSFWETPVTPVPLLFTPSTDWSCGQTDFRLWEEVPRDNVWLAHAGMEWRTAAGDEGGEPGWCTADWGIAEAVAAHARSARYAVLVQNTPPVPGVRLYQAPGVLAEEKLFSAPELAWACYVAAPPVTERTTAGAHAYPRLTVGWLQGPGAPLLYAEKAVGPNLSLDAMGWPTPPYLVPHMAWSQLADTLPLIIKPVR